MNLHELHQLIALSLPTGIWLFFAYLYEFLRLDLLFLVWLSSILFLAVNLYICRTIVWNFNVKSAIAN